MQFPKIGSRRILVSLAALVALIGAGGAASAQPPGSLAGTFSADATGRIAVTLNTGAGLGYITMEGIGATSGKRAGAVAQVLDNAPPVPGIAIAPHAVNSTASGTFYALGTRWPAN